MTMTVGGRHIPMNPHPAPGRPENGIRERVAFHGEQINRLWQEKASREALDNSLEDIREMKEALQAIQRVMVARPLERAKEREAAAKERKLDRRWMIATALTVTGLLIAAMAILLPTLGGS